MRLWQTKVDDAMKAAAAFGGDGVTTPCETPSALEEVSVLFIPFDAAGKFYKASAKKGVIGFDVRVQGEGKGQTIVDPGQHMPESEIAASLPAIVKQEVESIRNVHRPDVHLEDNFAALLESAGKDPSALSEGRRQKVLMKLKGYDSYPSLVFLSENPTKQAFPDRIDTGVPNMGYVKQDALDSATVPGIKPVNEMAVYVREDVAQRMASTRGEAGALYMETEHVTRSTAHLGGSKSEYLLKVTMGKRGGPSLTVAGAHLRAELTSASAAKRTREFADLQQFCKQSDIQLLVGDFNMDLQKSAQGSRGATLDHPPRFVLAEGETAAHPEVRQQFSNSAGNAHYMGFLQADTWTMGMVGPSMYGPMGGSGARSLQGGGRYYSDHPAIYVTAESREPPPPALKRSRSELGDDDLKDDRAPKLPRSGSEMDVD